MSYDGYQQPPPRGYNGPGPGAPRPPPQRQYPPGPGGPPQRQFTAPPPQQYDQYQDGYDDGYGYNDYGGGRGGGGGGHRPEYDQYDDRNYQRGPPPQNYPPQDYYGGPGPGPNGPGPGRGRPFPGPGGPGGPGGRGAPFPPRGGGPGPGPGRGFHNGPPGRGPHGPPGPGRPMERSATADPTSSRNNRPPISPQDAGFGGSPFPALPGHNRKTDLDEENTIIQRMGGLALAPERIDGGGPAPDGPRGGPPPQRGYGQGEYPDQRRGPGGPDQGYGPRGDYEDEGRFGPPGRTMTMPNVDPRGGGMRPPPGPMRADTQPFNGPGPGGPGPRMPLPSRPSTAQGMRGPPRNPPMNPPPLPQGGQYQGGGGYDGPGYADQGQQRPASIDDFYDYYGGSQENEYQDNRASSMSEGQNFRPVPPPNGRPSLDQNYPPGRPSLDQNFAPGRPSLDQSMPPGRPSLEQRGPGRHPEMSRTKSQPDLRQPQAAVFEMVGDMPAIPDQYRPYQPGVPMNGPGGGPGGGPGAFDPRQPQGLGLNGPAPARHGSGASTQSAPMAMGGGDSLPAHPAPIRPGLMPNSVANQMVNKPPPVRQYNNTPPPNANMPPAPPASISHGPPQQKAVEQKTPVTMVELESLRGIIKADPNDQDSALKLAKKLVEAMDVLVPSIPDPRGRAKARDRYATDAHKILKKLAHAQNAGAMFFMADCLGRGVFGAEPDNKEAFTLYQSAAKLGNAAAAYRTAVCCEIGHEEGGGTRKDPLKAIQWYKRAAMLGDTPAMYKVGMILLKGLLGQPKNPREAVGWLKRAAERADAENPHALHELALLYESAQPNDAILRDEAYALSLFKQAADLGYKFSQFRLGAAYEYGLMGCPIDPRLSIMWYSKAATQEEHQSELALSGWYLTGSEGVLAQSDTEAYLWARKAALAGLAKAEYAMGYFTEVGIGVPANMEDAKRWYWRAAAQDFPKARERLEDLKRSGKNGPRQRERISRSTPKQEGECVVM